jgi:diguanylate cyclase (GGDEF)-like protein/PAS domain S-box-containing protein
MTISDGGEKPEVLRRLLDELPAMVAYWDSGARNVVSNAAYFEWFGLTPDEVRGRHISEVLGEATYRLNLPYIEGALRGDAQSFDRTLVDTSGRIRHTQASYIPDLSEGRVIGFFVLVTDVTARVEAERATAEAVEQYRSLARSLPGAFVLLFDLELTYLIAEGAGLNDFGLTRDDVEGRSLWEVLPDLAQELEPRYRRALSGETSQWTRSLSGHTYELTAAPVIREDGQLFAGMVIGRDITAQRRLEVTDAALKSLAIAAARRAPLDEIVELVSRSTLELLDADYASVVRIDADGLRILSLSPDVGRNGELLLPNDVTASALVARSGTAQLIENELEENRSGILSELTIRASAAAPIRVGQQLWGTIGVAVRHSFMDRDAITTLLQAFADLISLAISNNEAWDELDRQAHRDPLTALPNRRVFEEQLERACKRAVRTRVPLAVVFIDLDHFKKVNDVYGHQTGDDTLVEVASRLRANSRGEEPISRLGGEEFAAVLTDCGPAELLVACERLRHSICDRPFPQGIGLTASIGAASRIGCSDPKELIRLADLALYEAKYAGRNRVILDPPPST